MSKVSSADLKKKIAHRNRKQTTIEDSDFDMLFDFYCEELISVHNAEIMAEWELKI